MAWIITLPVLVLVFVFVFDVYYVDESEEIRYELCRVEVENREHKKAVSEITSEVSSDYILEQKMEVPNEEVCLPILYYAIMLVLDILVGIVMIL